jgi:LysR family nitrogen assimilation transcriptional regulator
MDIRSLRYFVTAATLKSISKAANHLHVAQPALSRLLKKLEKDLGVLLLHRDSRGVRLTEAGTWLLYKGENILRQVDELAEEVRARGKDPTGRVSVALIPSVATLFAPLLVKRMRERHPAISLRLSEGLTTSIVGGLLETKFDLGLIPAEKLDAELVSVPLLTEPMFLVGPGAMKHAAKNDSPLTMQQLARYPLLLPSRGNMLRDQIESAAKRNGVTLDVKEDVDSSLVTKRLVISGLGYTVHCYSFVHEEVERGQLFVRPLRIPGLSRQWSLVRPRDHSQSLASIATAKVMLEIATEFSRSLPNRR